MREYNMDSHRGDPKADGTPPSQSLVTGFGESSATAVPPSDIIHQPASARAEIQANARISDASFQENAGGKNASELPQKAEEPSYRRLLLSCKSNSLWTRFKGNMHCRTRWGELNGSMGDMGTFIPIVIALTLVNGLDLGTTLIFTGIYNIATGWIFGVPMPVQPMKSIAAVAISEGKHLSIPEIMAAGICTAGSLFVLGITGLMGLVYRLIPLPVVRGVQLSQGLSFAFTAVKYMRKEQNLGKNKAGNIRPWLGWDGLLLVLLCFCLVVLVNGSGDDSAQGNKEIEQHQIPVSDDRARMDGPSNQDSTRRMRRFNWTLRILRRSPSALIVFLAGLLIAIARKPGVLKHLKIGPSKIHVVRISRDEWKTGFIRAAVPQIPLSVLNSVIAVCKLSTDLFPDKDVTATSVSVSVGMMNFVGCWLGAMPVCHGAGGLAGQYKFGARSGASVAFLGTAKLVLGLLLGSSLVKILTQFPVGLLGVLLLFSGVELAMASRDMNSKLDSFVMIVCTAVSLTGSSAALGFGCGVVLYVLLSLREIGFVDCAKSFPGMLRRRKSTSSEEAML